MLETTWGLVAQPETFEVGHDEQAALAIEDLRDLDRPVP